jgi:hypothetical protein
MTAPLTYTLFIDPSNHIHTDDEVVARELPLAEAMKTAMEHSGEFRVVLAHDDYDAFRVFTLYRFSKRTFVTNREKLFATVPRTADLVADEAAARQIIETQFLRWQRKFWKGAIMTSQDYAAREKHVARRREVDRIDKEIATKLIDALILGGYTITGDLLDDDGAFDHSTDRDGILKHLFDVEMAELLVHKEGDTAWLRLIFMDLEVARGSSGGGEASEVIIVSAAVFYRHVGLTRRQHPASFLRADLSSRCIVTCPTQ